ncbi:hypothetical protein JR316_0002875 [Psilocybe cubensis]|uniref:Uncharacterized protein n=2 Tax=Psilocybe cubensis TaxID=181762 RepID=A0ACB8H892_PSICU|nr:hypothetical protein JR316_0002875 [Psilocybe cubensis]KAH9483409.1 hypothetical protein JR316_0002875 [Psilocybe cubensis]
MSSSPNDYTDYSSDTPSESLSDEDHIPIMDFDHHGMWDGTEGPAIHTPENIRRICAKMFIIEYLTTYQPEEDERNDNEDDLEQNHIVSLVPFTEKFCYNDMTFHAARISMELVKGGFETDTLSVGQGSLNSRSYPLREGVTIGEIIDCVISNKMHHFAFLPYKLGNDVGWKGCRDFMLQFWAELIRTGIITTSVPEEESGKNSSLAWDLCVTYNRDGSSRNDFIGGGHYYSFTPKDDEYSPGHCVSLYGRSLFFALWEEGNAQLVLKHFYMWTIDDLFEPVTHQEMSIED